jgi:hypothetical protein
VLSHNTKTLEHVCDLLLQTLIDASSKCVLIRGRLENIDSGRRVQADNPQDNDHFLLNKAQPFHLDIDNDPDQVALDREEFNDEENNIEEIVAIEDEEKPSAIQSPLSKVCLQLLYCINSLCLELHPI